ncbi:trigger factor [Bilifractor porci]|uniref:Trigger factor n=1 Tax=Bilifractor porci TaxID=2606636 RepID=A0A7X2TN87_9FIRM|nr:trigger factor [Bilifractor porci]MST81235.1 trigger factor [Bilifractor porci]
MSVQVENLEKSMAKLTITVSAEDFEKALQRAYQKQKKNISIPGFRKGKVPRQVIEKMYGAGVFYEDAANSILPGAYADAAKESGLDITSTPQIDVTQIEKGKDFIFTATVALKPDVVLGQYKGVEVPKPDRTVTDEDVEKALKEEQEKNARQITVEDGGAENGDSVVMDYEGKIDGEPFEGGSAKNHTLVLGSGSFIPGFEDGLLGVKGGETRDVEVTFPEDYHAEELKGKKAVFTCKVEKVTRKELPELDDEFAQEVSEFDTLDAYKADVRKNLETKKEEAARQEIKDNAVSKAAQNSTIEIPAPMIDTQADRMIDNFARRLQAQGMSMQQYMQFTGSDENMMREQVKPQAEIQIRNQLTLEKIAETENIQVSDEELDQEIEKMAKAYNLEPDKMKEIIGDEEKENIRKDLAEQKAMDLVADAAVEVEKKEEPAKAEEAAEDAGEAKTEE